MISVWFTSDSHFGHKGILEYEKDARPFSTLEEMHEVLIERWNSVVRESDIVFHLGDFAFGKDNISIARRLNGKKRLILGNHDTYHPECYLPYFEKLLGMFYYKNCVLSHMPIHTNGLGSRWFLNLHGHLHSKRVGSMSWEEYEDFPNQKVMTFTEDKNYFNVSVEQNNLTPIHLDVVMERVKELTCLHRYDQI